MDTQTIIVFSIFGLALLVLLFFVFRLVVLWYYKIDQRILNQQEQIKIMKEILEMLKK